VKSRRQTYPSPDINLPDTFRVFSCYFDLIVRQRSANALPAFPSGEQINERQPHLDNAVGLSQLKTELRGKLLCYGPGSFMAVEIARRILLSEPGERRSERINTL